MEQGGYFIELYTRDERLKRDARIEGREEGKQVQQIEIAESFLRDGFPLEAVAKNTKLTFKKVKSLYEKLKKQEKNQNDKIMKG